METLLTILLGIIGLGVLVFVHELGHFLMAKLVGVEVEAFALGWGKTIWSRKRGKTEYRIAALPIGGYCKMKGEITPTDDPNMEVEEGSLYSVSPWKRILTYLGGPLFNLIFAILIFTIIGLVGYNYQTYPNQIVVDTTIESPAKSAGLQTGDTIIEVAGTPTQNFSDIRNIVAGRALIETSMVVVRDNKEITITLTPGLDKETGAGVLGIAALIPPVVGGTLPTGTTGAETAQPGAESTSLILQPGDQITSLANQPITYAQELFTVLQQVEEENPQLFIPGVLSSVAMTVNRAGTELTGIIYPRKTEDGYWDVGFTIAPVMAHTPELGFFQAIGSGFTRTFDTLTMTIRGLRNLFRGVDATKAISGPIQITYMLGDVAVAGLNQGFGYGARIISEFMALISIALAFGNLLPIPALDGGQICIGFYEAIRKRRMSPKIFYRLQLTGFAILIGLLLFTLWNDIVGLLFRV